MSCTCVCQLVCLTFCFKVIDSLMQDSWVTVYKQTDWLWPAIFWTIRLQKRDHSFRYSVSLQLQSWICVGMFCKRTIFCVSYMRIHILMSLIILTMKVWTVTVMSPQLVHIKTIAIFYSSTDPAISTPIFPYTISRNYFESIWQTCHFSDNSQQTQDSGQLLKIWPIY
jgi:hypothetical protein